MKARNIILTLAAVALLAAPATVLAQMGPGPEDGAAGDYGRQGRGHGWHGRGGEGDHMRFFEHMLPRMAEQLGLSDEQLEQIQAIIDDARPKIDELTEQLRTEREAYRDANDNPRIFNEAAFLAHAAAMHEIQTDLGVVVGQAKADVFGVLTDEQLEQFLEMRGKFGSNRSRRGGDRRSGS